MNDHFSGIAALAALGTLAALSVASAVGGWVLAAEIPDSVVLGVCLFFASALIGFLGWIGIKVVSISDQTGRIDERTKVIPSIDERLDNVETRLHDLEHP